MKTWEDLERAGYKYHHTAYHKGYVSVKDIDGIIEPYSGRFGVGYTIREHNPKSTIYCYISYYIKSPE